MLAEPPVLPAIASPAAARFCGWSGATRLAAGRDSPGHAGRDIRCGLAAIACVVKAGLVESRAEGRHRLYRARREALGPVGRMLEGMWSDALWRLKLQAELLETRRGPGGRARTGDPRHQKERRALMNLPHRSIARSSSRPRRRRSSAFSPRTTAGRRGGAPAPRSSRRRAAASTSGTPTASRVSGEVVEVGAAEADRLHLRLQQRQAHAARQLARDDQSRAARAGHAARSAARVRRRRSARRARAGLALSAVGLRQRGHGPRQRPSRRRRRRLVRRVVGDERGQQRGSSWRRSRARTCDSATATACSTASTTWFLISARRSASCPACTCGARATSGTARERCSSTGPRSRPTAGARQRHERLHAPCGRSLESVTGFWAPPKPKPAGT